MYVGLKSSQSRLANYKVKVRALNDFVVLPEGQKCSVFGQYTPCPVPSGPQAAKTRSPASGKCSTSSRQSF